MSSEAQDRAGVPVGEDRGEMALPPMPPAPGSSEWVTSMVHLYRGEVGRSNIWRTRLDATTNWAVVTTGAGLTFSFGGPDHPPVLILIVTLLVLIFLFIEARRYRYYELWTYRARLLETNFFADLVAPGHPPHSDWGRLVAQSLLHPAFPITLMEALGRRYRRNYALLFLVLAVSWIAKVAVSPARMEGWDQFLARAAVGPIPGWLMVVSGIVFNLLLLALGLFTVGLRRAEGEVLGEAPTGFLRLLSRLKEATREALELDLSTFRPHWPGGRKRLAFIISDEVEALREPLLSELDRGVTLIRGEGMYSGREHGILMCVLRGRQIHRLREIVYREDPEAFVVVSSAEDVRGEGFRPLET